MTIMTQLALIFSIVFCIMSLASAAEPSNADDAGEQLAKAGKVDLGIHDPSTIIKQGDRYWVFGTGPGVIVAYSDDLIHWHRAGSIFKKGEYPKWITDVVPSQKGFFWAPDVIYHDGKYMVYYSVSAMGKRTSAIALATSPTLDTEADNFGWTDEGIVIQTTEDNDYNAIDPAILFDQEGRMWMVFGSFWSGIKLIELDPKTGKRITEDSPMHALAWYQSIEAAAMTFHDGHYYLFVNWGRCCSGMESTYNIRVGRSRDITGPYIDKDGKKLIDGEGSPFLGTEEPNFIGPGHVGVLNDDDGKQYVSVHFYDGSQDGKPMLAIRELQWDADGWPKLPGPGDGAAFEGWHRKKK